MEVGHTLTLVIGRGGGEERERVGWVYAAKGGGGRECGVERNSPAKRSSRALGNVIDNRAKKILVDAS